MVAGKIANLPKGRPAENTQICGLSVTQSQAAELLNVGLRSVQHARAVLDHGAPELIAAVESGAVSVSAAAKATELPAEEQVQVVAEIDAGEKLADSAIGAGIAGCQVACLRGPLRRCYCGVAGLLPRCRRRGRGPL